MRTVADKTVSCSDPMRPLDSFEPGDVVYNVLFGLCLVSEDEYGVNIIINFNSGKIQNVLRSNDSRFKLVNAELRYNPADCM